MTQRNFLMTTASIAWLATAVAAQAQEASRVDDVVVTGSRIAGGERIAPVETVARQTIAAAGIEATTNGTNFRRSICLAAENRMVTMPPTTRLSTSAVGRMVGGESPASAMIAR